MIPLAGHTPPSVDRVLMLTVLMLAGHTPPSVDRVLMLNRADVGGPHSSERGPRADAERYGPG